jgi:hypothetical protein
MPKKPPETNYRSKDGPIPPEHFDNDLPFEPEKIDKTPGSSQDQHSQRIKQILENIKDTR